MAGKWMQAEGEREERAGTKGRFSRLAREHGMSTRAYAEQERGAKGRLGKEARMALAFMKAKH